ncbi:hypothetical protein D9C73_028580 [Collichthys lucidus]|uniref:ribonuclease H n=1 Tax=Collichthys lucidus TaxID=240159 RepID=A0A4U5TWN7_COLLU|nr:hypothetical protein D9C73_028580 [Collichthys lucidus]
MRHCSSSKTERLVFVHGSKTRISTFPFYPPHRRYLRFAFRAGVCYEYRVLPFGLSLSPRVFIRVHRGRRAPLRRRGIRLATYLDDWLLLAQSEQEARVHTRIVTEHLINLGFVKIWKSQLSPTQEICFLGLSLRSVPFTARLSEERVKAFKACLAASVDAGLSSSDCVLRLLGLMASAILVTASVVFTCGNFSSAGSLRSGWIPASWRTVDNVTADCVTALRHWRAPSFLTQGVSMGTVSSRKVVTTDASLSGWGGIFEGRGVRGRWSQALQRLHINVLELSAVFLSLKHFLPGRVPPAPGATATVGLARPQKIYGDGQGTMQYVTSVLNEWGQFVTTAVVVAAAESEGATRAWREVSLPGFDVPMLPGVQLYVSVKVVVLMALAEQVQVHKKLYGDGQGTMQYVTSVLNEWGQFVTTARGVAAAAESEGFYARMRESHCQVSTCQCSCLQSVVYREQLVR